MLALELVLLAIHVRFQVPLALSLLDVESLEVLTMVALTGPLPLLRHRLDHSVMQLIIAARVLAVNVQIEIGRPRLRLGQLLVIKLPSLITCIELTIGGPLIILVKVYIIHIELRLGPFIVLRIPGFIVLARVADSTPVVGLNMDHILIEFTSFKVDVFR